MKLRNMALPKFQKGLIMRGKHVVVDISSAAREALRCRRTKLTTYQNRTKTKQTSKKIFFSRAFQDATFGTCWAGASVWRSNPAYVHSVHRKAGDCATPVNLFEKTYGRDAEALPR